MVGPVRTRRSFAALSRSRNRGRSGPLWVVRADDDAPTAVVGQPAAETATESATDPVRVAYAVGRSVGPAVVRNRLRRRLRALVTELDRSDDLGEGLYLVGATPAAVGLPFDQLRVHLRDAVARVA